MIARQERDLEQQRSSLQAEGHLVGRQVGELIRIRRSAPNSPEVQAACANQGCNRLKQQVGVLWKKRRRASTRLRDQLLAFPI